MQKNQITKTLKRVDLDGYEMTILDDLKPNDDQIKALIHLVKFLKSKSKSTSLCGPAGTGKTFSTKLLLQYIREELPDLNVVLAAPTHKAKIVLSRLSEGGEATTLHKLLGLKPNISIEDFDAKDIEFLENYKLDFFDVNCLYVIDECSMINDDLFDLIIKRLTKDNNKVLFIGDSAQLKPVKQKHLSKCFNGTDYPGFKLAKVMRQIKDVVFVNELIRLREDVIDKFETKINENSSLIVYDDVTDFLRPIKEAFSTNDFIENPFKCRVACYTNSRVAAFNKIIRRLLKRDGVFAKGEILMGYDNFIQRGNDKYKLYNANDYILLGYKKGMLDIPYHGKVSGYLIRLMDTVDKSKHNFQVLDPHLDQKIIDRISFTLETFRLSAINKFTSSYEKKLCWNHWYTMKDSFITMYDMVFEGRVVKKASLNYGYALTIHKLQGSSYDEIFIDMNDIKRNISREDKRALQYVSASRARNKIYILQ